MGDSLDDLLAEPLPEFHDPLLVAGWAEVPAFAGKRQEILVTAVLTSDPGKSVMEDTAVEISINDVLHIGTEKAVLFFKPLFIDLSECLEMVFNTPVIR